MTDDTSVFAQLRSIDPDAHAALEAVAAECIGQRQREGWTPDHDDTHVSTLHGAAMANAAASYAMRAGRGVHDHRFGPGYPPAIWPWDAKWWKPKDEWRDLTRAAALCIAEMGRRLRVKENRNALR